jgi:hypothetical protein
VHFLFLPSLSLSPAALPIKLVSKVQFWFPPPTGPYCHEVLVWARVPHPACQLKSRR